MNIHITSHHMITYSVIILFLFSMHMALITKQDHFKFSLLSNKLIVLKATYTAKRELMDI